MNIPTGSTEIDGSSSNCSYSDDDSSEKESNARGESGSLVDSSCTDYRWSGSQICAELVSGNHPHIAVLRAWYCYERMRGLIYSCTPENLSKILKEAEPLYYSD